MNVGQAIMNKLSEILSYSQNNEKKIITLNNQNKELYQMMQGIYKMKLKSQIPYMTPRQLVALLNRGWTIEELSILSGYPEDEVCKKIQSYKNV